MKSEKPRYRFVTIGECPNGTRFYTSRIFKPMTLITSSRKKNSVWVHFGHEFDIRAKRITWGYRIKGWVKV